MFNTLAEVKAANKAIGNYWFDRGTINFFSSKIESTLYNNQCFISSEKKCFTDYTRVYTVRRANPDGSIKTLKTFSCKDNARIYARSL